MKTYFIHMITLALILLGILGFIVGSTLNTANSYKDYRSALATALVCVAEEKKDYPATLDESAVELKDILISI